MTPAATRRRSSSSGFTIVELLVVLGVLIAIITTIVVGAGQAIRRARIANTDFLMMSLSVGLVQFRVDMGYFPPVLGNALQLDQPNYPLPDLQSVRGWARDAVAPPQLTANPDDPPERVTWGAQEFARVQRWYSVTTLPEYLVGAGDRSEDGYGIVLLPNAAMPTAAASQSEPGLREVPPLGIRNPGADGVWGAFLEPRDSSPGGGTFLSRNLASASSTTGNSNSRTAGGSPQANQDPKYLVGRSYGPYLELKSDADIGAFVGLDGGGTPIAVRPAESVPAVFGSSAGAPKAMLDYFGNPIQYYRRGYRNNDPKDVDRRFSLADVVALRPAVFAPGEATEAVADLSQGAAPDTGTSRAALGAEFALFSRGPDRRWSQAVRADADGFNEDNIVRFGP